VNESITKLVSQFFSRSAIQSINHLRIYILTSSPIQLVRKWFI